MYSFEMTIDAPLFSRMKYNNAQMPIHSIRLIYILLGSQL